MEAPSGMPAAEVTAATAPSPSLSPMARFGAIFTKPASAWTGLQERAQWWIPLVITSLCGVLFVASLHERAMVPMITERWEQMVENGQMTAEQVEKMEAGMRGPVGLISTSVWQLIAWPLMLLVLALVVSFGVGFVLGTKMKFRLAFEVVNWGSLVLLPSYVITWVLAWNKETMKGIHLGLGALVPVADTPTKLQVGLTSLLDAIGVFNLWFLVVAIIGASALSGAPRKSVAWVLGGLYLALAVFMSALGALFTPGS